MTAADSRRERRAAGRLAVNGDVQARMQTGAVVPVVDLSPTGALLEVYTVLRPGSVHPLRLNIGVRDELAILIRVVRSFIHRFDHQGRGEAQVLYRVAVEFVDMRPMEETVLERWLSSLRYTAVDGGDFDTDLAD